MALKKGGLGRGLASILQDNDTEEKENITTVRLADVEPNSEQPRKEFDSEDLASLADSVAEYGVLQPITVRRTGLTYQIIAGERRWRAARMAGLSEIPVIITDVDDKKASEIALVENIQRKDLKPLEEAEAYRTLVNEYSLTQEEVGRRVGKSRTYITNSIRLLDLPFEIKKYINDGTISEGHAKVLLGIKDKKVLEAAAKTVADNGMSVRETERLVKALNAPKNTKKKPSADGIDYTKNLEKEIEKQLGRTVRINEKDGKGTITIGYTDNKDLEKLIAVICGEDFTTKL